MRLMTRLFLILMTALLVTISVSAQGGSLQAGDVVEGELTRNNLSIRFPIDGVAGDVVTIILRSDDFDAYLILEDPSGVELETNDDGAGNLNSRIGPFTFPTDGSYTIIATSLSRNDTGPFTLSVQTTDIRPIEYTQSIESELTDDRLAALYTFRGQAGDSVGIRMTSGDFDAYLELAMGNNANNVLMTNDDSGGTRNSFIGPFSLPETGNYIITARSLGGSNTGDFVLTLDRVVLTPIAYGDTVVSDFVRGDQTFYFSFEAQAGDVVSVVATSDDGVDSVLTLNDPDGFLVANDDDSGRGFDPELNRVLINFDGTYTILLSSFGSGETGTVALTLEQAELASLDDGPQQIKLNDKIFQEILIFEGQGGEFVTLTLVEVDGRDGSPNVSIMQDGFSIANMNADAVSVTSFGFEVPADGDVTVRVEDFSFETVNYEVTLERESTDRDE